MNKQDDHESKIFTQHFMYCCRLHEDPWSVLCISCSSAIAPGYTEVIFVLSATWALEIAAWNRTPKSDQLLFW